MQEHLIRYDIFTFTYIHIYKVKLYNLCNTVHDMSESIS